MAPLDHRGRHPPYTDALKRVDEKGLAWFEAYWDNKTEIPATSAKGRANVAFSATLSFGIAWLLAQVWAADLTRWPLFWRSAVIGLVSLNAGFAGMVAVTGAVALLGAMAGAGVGAGVGSAAGAAVAVSVSNAVGFAVAVGGAAGKTALTAIGVSVGLWIRAILTRSVATFSHPLAGLQAIPKNWQRVVWYSDVRDPPELLPGHETSSFLTLVAILKGDRMLIIGYIFYFFVLLTFCLTAMLLHWSIKSTAWFYLPLLWVGRGWQDIHGEDLLIWAKGYSHKWINITGVFLAMTLLCVSLTALIVPSDYFDLRENLKNAGAPMPVIGWAFVLDWQSLAAQPWQWFWVLTLLLFFLIDDHGIDIEKGAKAEPRLPIPVQKFTFISLGVAEGRISTDHGLTGIKRDRLRLEQAIAAVRDDDVFVAPKPRPFSSRRSHHRRSTRI